jgi:hypothetical protein
VISRAQRDLGQEIEVLILEKRPHALSFTASRSRDPA